MYEIINKRFTLNVDDLINNIIQIKEIAYELRDSEYIRKGILIFLDNFKTSLILVIITSDVSLLIIYIDDQGHWH